MISDEQEKPECDFDHMCPHYPGIVTQLKDKTKLLLRCRLAMNYLEEMNPQVYKDIEHRFFTVASKGELKKVK